MHLNTTYTFKLVHTNKAGDRNEKNGMKLKSLFDLLKYYHTEILGVLLSPNR
jgi:hypothetical protein